MSGRRNPGRQLDQGAGLTQPRTLCSRRSKEAGPGRGLDPQVTFKQGCYVVPLTFAKFPVAAVGQKFCQGQERRQREGRPGAGAGGRFC